MRQRIEELEEILASEKKLKAVIVTELREIQKDLRRRRAARNRRRVEEIKVEDLIEDVDMAITISHAGYIKRTSVDVIVISRAAAKGRIGAETRDDDFVEHLFLPPRTAISCCSLPRAACIG